MQTGPKTSIVKSLLLDKTARPDKPLAKPAGMGQIRSAAATVGQSDINNARVTGFEAGYANEPAMSRLREKLRMTGNEYSGAGNDPKFIPGASLSMPSAPTPARPPTYADVDRLQGPFGQPVQTPSVPMTPAVPTMPMPQPGGSPGNPLAYHNKVGPIVPPSPATQQLQSDMSTLFGQMGAMPGGSGGNPNNAPPLSGMPGAPDRFAPPPRGQFPQQQAGGQQTPLAPTGGRPGFQQTVRDTGFPADMAARSPLLSAAFLDAKTGQDPNYRYQPAPSPPTPAAQYGSAIRENGLMTDQQAGQFYANNPDPVSGDRYMPKTTVGGAWGQRPSNLGQLQQAGAAPGEYVSPRLGQNDIMRGTDPVRDALVGKATTAKLMENPDGRWFGGAQINPRANSAPGVATFIDPSRPASPVRQAMGLDEAAKRAVARNPSLSISESGALVGSPNPAFAPPTAEQLAKNKAAYDARRDKAQGERQDNVEARAMARAEARRVRMGDLSAQERIAMADPRGAAMGQVAKAQNEFKDRELRQQGELAQGELKLRERLGMENAAVAREGNQARLQQGQMEAAGQQIEAISAMEAAGQMTKQQANAARAQAFQRLQGGAATSPVQQAIAGPQGPKSLQTLPPNERQQVMEQPPEAREDFLVGQGYSRGEAAIIAAEANGESRPGAPGFWDSPAGKAVGGLASVFGAPAHGAFAPPIPEPSRPTFTPSPGDLIDQPGDTEAQKRARNYFRGQKNKPAPGAFSGWPFYFED